MNASSYIADDQKSVVIYPQGQPESEDARDNLAKILISCGADPMRHIDHTYSSLDEARAFERYAKYVRYLDDQTLTNAIVLLHKTESVPYGILQPRQKLVGAIPQLKTALWCIYIDPERDPLVISNLQNVGEVFGLRGQEQVFVDYRRNIYLLLRSDCKSMEVLNENAKQIRKNTSGLFDREKPTTGQIVNNEPPLSRDDFLGANSRPTPRGSYPAPRMRSSRPIPIVRPRSVTADTNYKFLSEFPTKPRRGNE